MFEYEASFGRIIDGDTVVFEIDLGFSIYARHSVRLAGVNAPELRTPEGRAAAEWVAEWFMANPGPHTLRTRRGREVENYGRYLGTVVSLSTARVLNDDIVSAGHAVPFMTGR